VHKITRFSKRDSSPRRSRDPYTFDHLFVLLHGTACTALETCDDERAEMKSLTGNVQCLPLTRFYPSSLVSGGSWTLHTRRFNSRVKHNIDGDLTGAQWVSNRADEGCRFRPGNLCIPEMVPCYDITDFTPLDRQPGNTWQTHSKAEFCPQSLARTQMRLPIP